MTTKKKVVFIIAFLGMLCGTAFAVKNNDFTKSNSSFSKKYDSQKSELGDKKSRLQDSEVHFDRMKFVSPENATYLQDKKAYISEDLPAKSMSKERVYNNDKSFQVPEYMGKTKSDKWSKPDREIAIDNLDRDLSKKYIGKIDTSRRDVFDQNYMREHYDEMVEKSMQDINKYYFRETHSTEAGIPIQIAGGEGKEESSSMFDFLSLDKKIERPKVTLRGPASDDKVQTKSTSSTKSSPQTPSRSPQAIDSSSLPQGMKLMPPVVNRSDSQKQIADKDSNNKSSKVKVYETVDPNTIKNFQMMKVPDELRGETIMKVEVREDIF